MRRVLGARTIPQLQDCLSGLKDSGELQRAAARLGSGGAAEAPGARRSAAQQAAAPSPAAAHVESPGAERERGGSSGQRQLLPKKRASAWPAVQDSGMPSSKRAAVLVDGGSLAPLAFPAAAARVASQQAPAAAAQGRAVPAAAAAAAQQGTAHHSHHRLNPLLDDLHRQPPQNTRFNVRTGWTAELSARLAQLAGDPAYLAPGSSSSRPDWERIGEELGCSGSSASRAYYKLTHAGQPGAQWYTGRWRPGP